MKAFIIFILVIGIGIVILFFYKKQFGIKNIMNKFKKYNDMGLTREEKETSNRYRKELSYYRIFSKLTYETMKETLPQLEKLARNESEFQDLKERQITRTKEELAKFPYLVYFHACDRLNITPLNHDNAMNFAGDPGLSLIKALEHKRIINGLIETITTHLDLIAISAYNEEEIDGAISTLIEKTIKSLKIIENK